LPSRYSLAGYGWILLLVTGLGILGFGVLVVIAPEAIPGYSGQVEYSLLRTAGVATVGFGIFGLATTMIAFRRFERWSWYVLWFYPIFWSSHLAGLGVKPGIDDMVFIIISVAGLALPAKLFFQRGG
jgi:hypothetical protein